jgi:LysM repeat protein
MSTKGDSSWRSIPFDRRRPVGGGTIRLTLGSLILILGTNALISLFISLAVFFILGGRGTPPPLTPPPTAAVVAGADARVDSLGAPTPSAGGGSSSAASASDATTSDRTDLYVVKSGDSLSAIAARFGLSMSELMAANGLQNPDWIAVGQKLAIPKAGAPTPTSTVPPVPTLTETPLPFEPPTAVPTRTPSSSVFSSPTNSAAGVAEAIDTPTPAPAGPPVVIERVAGSGNIASEEIIIASRGKQINLEKWTLSDGQGNTFKFPNVILWSDQAPLHIHTGKGVDSPTDLYWNRTESVWKGRGELATLKDAQGNVIDTFKP